MCRHDTRVEKEGCHVTLDVRDALQPSPLSSSHAPVVGGTLDEAEPPDHILIECPRPVIDGVRGLIGPVT